MVDSGRDYSFLRQAPGQLAALFKQYGVTMEHPVLPLPDADWVVQTLGVPNGRGLLEKGLADREQLIGLMEKDPLRYGYEPACWARARQLLDAYRLLLITTRNRNTKSEFAGKEVVKRLLEKPKARIWCLCESHETSIRGGGQQELIWKYLPPELKALNGKRNDVYAINYTPKNRFTDSSFILPNGSECRFMNYEQKIEIIEGGAIDLFWADELAPVEWVITLIGRLIDRNGHGLVTFTPIKGWNETYAMVFQGSTVKEWQDFPLHKTMRHWPGGELGKIPYIVEAVDPRFAGMFFPPDANPFVSFAALLKEWSTATYDVQMIRLAGIAKKKVGNRFPKFGKPHIIPAHLIPKSGTRWHALDFAWERNWFQLWALVQRVSDKRRIFIYREWPDKKTYGEWAIRSSKPNGDRGPAQSAIGLSVTGYRDLIEQLETPCGGPQGDKSKREVIFKRIGDPRSGKAPAVTRDEGGTCLIDMMGEAGVDIVPAKGLQIGEGVNIINELFDYNEEQYLADGGRFTPLNEPELFISEECEQLIDCLMLWTGQGSEKEQASKDPVDLLRYLVTDDLDDYPPMVFGSSGGGAY